MATVRNDKTTSLKIVVVTGKKEDGSDKTATRTIAKINPDLTDDQVYSLAVKIGGLQEYTVNSYSRVDSGELAPEE